MILIYYPISLVKSYRTTYYCTQIDHSERINKIQISLLQSEHEFYSSYSKIF